MPVEIYKGLFVGPGKIPLFNYDFDVIISLDCSAKPYGVKTDEEYCYDIIDFDVEPVWRIGETLETLDNKLSEGKKIYLHCRAGCGRTGTVAIAFLIMKGYSLEDAEKIFFEKRGCGPEDYKQLEFLRTFESAVKKYGVEKTLNILKNSRSLEDFIIKSSL